MVFQVSTSRLIRRTRRVAGLLLGASLLVGIVPAHAHAMKQGSCGTPQESSPLPAAAMSHHHGMAAPRTGDAVVTPAPATCDHCPAQQCAGLAPCSGTAPMLGAQQPACDAGQAMHQNARAGWLPALSPFFQPPTPPPTRIL